MGSRKGGEPVPGTKNLWGVEILKIRIDYILFYPYLNLFFSEKIAVVQIGGYWKQLDWIEYISNLGLWIQI